VADRKNTFGLMKGTLMRLAERSSLLAREVGGVFAQRRTRERAIDLSVGGCGRWPAHGVRADLRGGTG